MAAKKSPKTTHIKKGSIPDGPWEPTPKQMEWYLQWTEELKSQWQIARESKPPVARQTVNEAVHKVAEWLRISKFDHIMEFRDRQTAIHEKIARDAFKKFYEKRELRTTTEGVGSGEDGEPFKTVKTEEVDAQCVYLNTAMAAMKAIRDIWGVNSPVKTEVKHQHHAEEVPDLPPQNAFSSRAEAYAALSKIMADRAAALSAGQKHSSESS